MKPFAYFVKNASIPLVLQISRSYLKVLQYAVVSQLLMRHDDGIVLFANAQISYYIAFDISLEWTTFMIPAALSLVVSEFWFPYYEARRYRAVSRVFNHALLVMFIVQAAFIIFSAVFSSIMFGDLVLPSFRFLVVFWQLYLSFTVSVPRFCNGINFIQPNRNT